MKAVRYSVDFDHKKGEFCPRMCLEHHFISFFRTDFLYEKNGRLLRGNSGDMLIIRSGELVWHGPTPEMAEGFRNDWMHINGEDFIDLVKKYALPIGTPFRVGGRHTLAHCIEKIKDEQAACRSGYEDMCEVHMTEAIIKLHRAYEKELHNEKDEKIKDLRIKLVEDAHRGWTLGSMAEFCGYSPSHFSSLYGKMYGISPISDLINIRLENAKMMLSYSSMTISEICYTAGFSSLYYFSKCFKKNTGLSPTEYRKSS